MMARTRAGSGGHLPRVGRRVALVIAFALRRGMPRRYNIAATTMDETPEEMDQIRREAGEIDVYRYRNRFRFLRAIGVGALMAGLVWLILTMLDSRRNPCERVRDHFCKKDPAGIQCTSYREIMEESLH